MMMIFVYVASIDLIIPTTVHRLKLGLCESSILLLEYAIEYLIEYLPNLPKTTSTDALMA